MQLLKLTPVQRALLCVVYGLSNYFFVCIRHFYVSKIICFLNETIKLHFTLFLQGCEVLNPIEQLCSSP